MKKFIYIFAICVFTFNLQQGAEAQAVAPQKITMQQAIELAIKSNTDLQAAKLNIDIQTNNIKAANRLQNPGIASAFNTGELAGLNPQQIAVQEVIEVAKRGARKAVAKSNLELEKQNYKLAEFRLKMNVRKSYVNTVAAKSIYSVLVSQQNLLKDLYRIANRRVEVGEAPELDRIQAELALEQLTTQVNSARADVNIAKNNFNKTLNIQTAKIIYEPIDNVLQDNQNFIGLLTPKSRAKLPDFNTVKELSLCKRHDLQIARQNIDVAQKNVTLVKRQRVPDFQVLGGYGYQTGANTTNGNYLSGGFFGVNLVNLPVLYNYSPEIKNAKSQVEQSKLAYNTTYNAALNDLKSSYETFTTAQTNLNFYSATLIKKSDEMIRISKRSYEVGKSNLTSLIVMEQSYQNIRTGYIQALATYYDTWIDFLTEVDEEEFSLDAQNLSKGH